MLLPQYSNTYFSSLLLTSIIVLYKKKRAFFFFLLSGEKADLEGRTAFVTL